MPRKSRHETSSLRSLHERYVGDDPERLAALQAEREKAGIAERIYWLRADAGLTQAELARRMGTSPSVISRLESTDYEGVSLSTLRRLAAALDCRVEVVFVPVE